MEPKPRGGKLDRRWVRPTVLAIAVAAVSAGLAYVVTLVPLDFSDEAKRIAAWVVMMSCSVAGFAWVVVVAFDAFDVEAKSGQG